MSQRHMQVTAPRSHPSGACTQVSSILARVGDKWTVLVVMNLAAGPRRFNNLKGTIGGISQRMLTLTLRGLERDGLVTRTIFPSNPPKVDYELTSLGHSLRVPIEALGEWAFTHVPIIEEARVAFDTSRGLAGGTNARVLPNEDQQRSPTPKLYLPA